MSMRTRAASFLMLSLAVLCIAGMGYIVWEGVANGQQTYNPDVERPQPKGVWKADIIELNELRIKNADGNSVRILSQHGSVGVWTGTAAEGAAVLTSKGRAYLFLYKKSQWRGDSSIVFYIGDDGEPMLEFRRPGGKVVKLPFKDLYFNDGVRYGPPPAPSPTPVPTMPGPSDEQPAGMAPLKEEVKAAPAVEPKTSELEAVESLIPKD